MTDTSKQAQEKFGLSQLGSNVDYPATPEEALLEVIELPESENELEVTLLCHEFTCFCPITKQPDYAEMEICYHPNGKIVETKSLKLYLASYRDQGIFHEFVVNKILDDLRKVLEPEAIEVKANFHTRGGIGMVTTAQWRGEFEEEE